MGLRWLKAKPKFNQFSVAIAPASSLSLSEPPPGPPETFYNLESMSPLGRASPVDAWLSR